MSDGSSLLVLSALPFTDEGIPFEAFDFLLGASIEGEPHAPRARIRMGSLDGSQQVAGALVLGDADSKIRG
jgi:hypothetical protein